MSALLCSRPISCCIVVLVLIEWLSVLETVCFTFLLMGFVTITGIISSLISVLDGKNPHCFDVIIFMRIKVKVIKF